MARRLGQRGGCTARTPSRRVGAWDFRAGPSTTHGRADGWLAVARLVVSAQRASAALPGFSLAQHAATVARICWQVDGIPLALELAAVWVRVLSVEQIAERLSDAPRLLTTGSRLAPARQRTLRATFEWSYSLLSEPQRVLQARVSVFVGGWSLEACAEVCGDDRRTASHTMGNLNRERVLELLGGLIDKSLVFAEPAADGMRYRMLEPLRQFALERLVEQDAASTMPRRHATWVVAVAP